MVIPWAGYSLSRLLERVEPLGSAKYVAMETLFDPKRMPGQKTSVLAWPYVEGLRLDEAMHPLTLLSVNVNEAVPADEPPIRMLPAEITEVDASAGTAPITMTSPASSVAARPKLTARLVWSPTSGGLQLSDLTVTDAAFGVVTAVRSRPSVN